MKLTHLLLGLVVLAVVDTGSTYFLLETGRFREENPLGFEASCAVKVISILFFALSVVLRAPGKNENRVLLWALVGANAVYVLVLCVHVWAWACVLS